MTPQHDTYGVSQLNLPARLFWCEDLGTGTITALLDEDGDFTDDEACAVVAIVKYRADCWLHIRVRDYAPQPRQ